MVNLDDLEFSVDLIVLQMLEFDVILGMDWLSSHHVSLDCFAKTVCLTWQARCYCSYLAGEPVRGGLLSTY